MPPVDDIAWYDRFDDALDLARRRHRILLAKPAGQGLIQRGGVEFWCPGANYQRAVALSDPAVVSLINDRFVAVRFALWINGDGTDLSGLKFISGHQYVSPPGLAAYHPDGHLLGRTQDTDGAQHTLNFLTQLLIENPDLADGWTPDADYYPYEQTDPEQARVLALESQIPNAAEDEQIGIERELAQLFASLVERQPDAAALAGVLLGDSRFHLSDFRGANAAWAEVVERWPHHPLSHRARHNMLDKSSYPTAWHPSLRSARKPECG